MASSKRPQAKATLILRVFRTFIPGAILIVVLATATALFYAHIRTGGAASAPSRQAFWGALAIGGCAEAIAIAFAFLATLRLSRALSQPIAQLAREALSLTEAGAAGNLSTDGSISELDDLSTAFNRLLDEQRHRLREISELSSTLLHDIKTPLANMRNTADAALSEATDTRDALLSICANCDYLLDTITTENDIASLSAGLGRKNLESVDLTAEADKATQLYGCAAEVKGQKLVVTLPSNPLPIPAHRYRIQQLISNLLDNAIKYTPDGGTVSLTLRPDGQDAVLTVADTGIGICESDRPKIFSRFFRADRSRTSPGFGLGLPLVKAIVDFYHGTIACESVPLRGTTFIVTLPGGQSQQPPASTVRSPQAGDRAILPAGDRAATRTVRLPRA